MHWDFVFAREVQNFSKRRYAFALYRLRNARADQVCRVARENNPDINAGLLSTCSMAHLSCPVSALMVSGWLGGTTRSARDYTFGAGASAMEPEFGGSPSGH